MKGILFKKEMFLAATQDKNPKTQTRRIESSLVYINARPHNFSIIADQNVNGNCIFYPTTIHDQTFTVSSRYSPGETVYLKEPFKIIEWDYTTATIQYRYHDVTQTLFISDETVCALKKWKRINQFISPLMMFADFARYHITIQKVTAQRLADISEEDCIAEGYTYKSLHAMHEDAAGMSLMKMPDDPILWYHTLITQIHGPDLWNQNPWVFAYEFSTTKLPLK